MSKVDEMWAILNDIEIPTGKLCIPITGGLDSRVLAGVVRQHREIDYSYFYWSEGTRMNVPHVQAIADRCRVKKFELIKLDNVYNTDDAVDEIKRILPKSDYIWGCNHHGDVMTGMKKSRSAERDYFLNELLVENENKRFLYTETFKSIWRPWWNSRITGFMLSLPRWDRIFQRLYVEMIKKYLPDLAKIPRCYESYPGGGKPTRFDKGLVHYTFRRFVDKKL